MAGFILFLAFLGHGLDHFVLGYRLQDARRRGKMPLPVATILAVFGEAISAWVSYRSGDTLVLRACHATPLTSRDLPE